MPKRALSREVARKRILCKPVLHERAFYASQRTPRPPKRTKAITPKAEIGKNADQGRQGLGRVRFLARLEAIRVAVGQGYPLRMIYEAQQRDGLGISYSQFARYVNQFVHAAGDATPARRGTGTVGARGGDQVRPPKSAVSAPPGFRYRPTQGDGDDEIV
jgi:hypothetical protein